MGRTVWALGADGPRALEFYLISELFGKVFEKNLFRGDSPRVFGGRSEINLESDRSMRSLGRPSGRSAAYPRTAQGPGRQSGSWRTVRPVQRATLTAVDFVFLPLEFKCGHYVRASWTVCKVRVFDIMAGNGKGNYKYSMPRMGESLLAL
jgi:hypothetical protein